MHTITIEMHRGAGWETRATGESDATLDQMREAMRAYAVQYPHRVIVGRLLLVAVPPPGRLDDALANECHAYAVANCIGNIEFLAQ